MPDQNNDNGPDPLAHLPKEVLERIGAEAPPETIQAAAPCDLDAGGMYAQGHLVLTDTHLGHFLQDDGRWDVAWHALSDVKEAKLVEGLGVNALRLLGEGGIVAEYRFTLRHAREVAKLHRRMERALEGEAEAAEAPAEPAHETERKLRCEKCGRVIPPWSEFCPACTSRRKILFRVLEFVRGYKWRAIFGAAMAVSLVGVGLTQTWLRRPMINEGLGAANGSQGQAGAPDWPLFLRYALLLSGLIVVAAIGRGIQSRLMAGLGSRVARTARDAVYNHLHKLSLSFFSKKQTGSLVTRVTTDSDRLWDFVAFTVVEVTVAFLTIAGGAIAMFAMNWRLAMFVLMPVPVMIALTVFFHKKLHRVFHRIMHRWSQMTAVAADALPGVRVIKAFSQEGREVRRFGRKNEQVYDQEMDLITTWTTFGPVMQFCTQLGVLIVWLLGGWWVYQDYLHRQQYGSPMPGGVDVGTLVAFLGFMLMFYRPIHMIAHMDRMFNRAATSAQRIFEILDTEPGIYSKKQATHAERLAGRIELRNVSFSYDGVRRVLTNIDLKIEPGEMVGLAGPSGGGKTTMVNLICRFYDVLDGRILVDDVDVRDYDLHTLRRQIGVVLQEPFLFHGTVAENIAYGNADATLDEILEAARAANAHDFIVGFTDGYDTLVGERGQTLSGGERQRISIARAILNNPKILILDEATSSVDTETEKLIQQALDRLVANRTTIAIAHRLSTLRKADRLVILEKGNIVEQGTHDQLAAKDGGLYAKLLRMQNETQSIMAISG
jgi:ATP-binding cassette subfamily B protein